MTHSPEDVEKVGALLFPYVPGEKLLKLPKGKHLHEVLKSIEEDIPETVEVIGYYKFYRKEKEHENPEEWAKFLNMVKR